MITHLFKVHLECKSTRKQKFFKNLIKRAFTWKALFFLFFCLNSNQNFALRIAVFDTGFCPSLLEKSNHFVISQVKDVTQSVTYKCNKHSLKNRQFHGQWVLSELLKTKLKEGSNTKIKVFPFVIFNNRGVQEIRYWKRAIEEAKKLNVDFVVAAAGLPTKNTKEREKAAQIGFKDLPFLLAAGRRYPGINKGTILFPHDFLDQESRLIFGTYFEGVDHSRPHFKDLELLEPKKVNYFLPFNFKPRVFGELKGTSLAVSLATRYILETCLKAKADEGAFSFMGCLKSLEKERVTIKVKHQKSVEEVYSLPIP